MQGVDQLKELMDEVVSRTLVNKRFKARLDILSPEGRAEDIKRVAEELKIDPGIVDNYDLAGIEGTVQSFIEEVQLRFFEAPSVGPER